MHLKFTLHICRLALVGTFLAMAVNSANADIELTCHTTSETIDSAKSQLLKLEGMTPVTSHFRNLGTDEKAEWAMTTLMMNPVSRNGYEWVRLPQGHVCISKRYSSIELMSNTKFSARAFVDIKMYPKADDVGDGKNLSTSGINATLLGYMGLEKYTMYKAIVEDVIDVDGRIAKQAYKTRNVEFLLSNPKTKEGVLLTAGPDGKVLGRYTRVPGTPRKDGVKFGVIYSPAAEEMLGLIQR